MKPTLLFAALSMVFALPASSATTELESLRAKCAEQEQQIRHLESQLGKHSVTSTKSTDTAAHKSTKADDTENTATPGTYSVRAGDSLERIARRNHCSPTSLAKANGLKPSSIIRPGQKLKLPGSAEAKNPVPAVAKNPAPATTTSPVSSPAPGKGKTHTIRGNDTYSSIARKYKVSVASLIAANPGVKPTALRSGQVIRLSAAASDSSPAPQSKPAVPQSKPAAPVVPTPAPKHPTAALTPSPAPAPAPAAPKTPTTPEAVTPPAAPTPPATPGTTPPVAPGKASTPAPVAPAPAKTPASNTIEKKIRSVTIESEMTYGEFATKHGTDITRLNDLNGLDLAPATVLAKGSELYVPAQP